MPTRTKTFDCVETKRRTQEKLRAEYESRKAEFPSLVDFLNAKARALAAKKPHLIKSAARKRRPSAR